MSVLQQQVLIPCNCIKCDLHNKKRVDSFCNDKSFYALFYTYSLPCTAILIFFRLQSISICSCNHLISPCWSPWEIYLNQACVSHVTCWIICHYVGWNMELHTFLHNNIFLKHTVAICDKYLGIVQLWSKEARSSTVYLLLWQSSLPSLRGISGMFPFKKKKKNLPTVIIGVMLPI